MTNSPQALGSWGETLAMKYLMQRGYTIIDRNIRTPFGEIDLLAQIQDTLVFVEVKTRSTDSYGLPEAAVTRQKREHMVDSAVAYLQESSQLDANWRIDVIAPRKRSSDTPPEITHFENAVT